MSRFQWISPKYLQQLNEYSPYMSMVNTAGGSSGRSAAEILHGGDANHTAAESSSAANSHEQEPPNHKPHPGYKQGGFFNRTYQRENKHHSKMGFHLLHDAIRYVNDPTMRLSPYVDRPWLEYHFGVFENEAAREAAKPRRKLVLADFGWNSKNISKGLEFPRVVRSREILQAYLDHPDFDPTFQWSDALDGTTKIDPEVQYVAMLDVETCFESNYPGYYNALSGNYDQHAGRIRKSPNMQPCYNIPGCTYIKEALSSPLFTNHTKNKLIVIECRGNGPPPKYRQTMEKSPQLTLVSISSEPSQLLLDAPGTDMGLIPPAGNPVILPHALRQAILDGSCSTEDEEHRPYLLSFVGSVRHNWRTELYKVHNGKDVIAMGTSSFKNSVRDGHMNVTFHELMMKSVFSAAPRGDNRFSYRFTEVLSSGAIPVVHSDGWVYAFRPELVDWRECAVILPESTMNQTHEILRQISTAQRCRMRKKCLELYQNYCANPEGTIAGILDSLDAVAAARATSETATAIEAATKSTAEDSSR